MGVKLTTVSRGRLPTLLAYVAPPILLSQPHRPPRAVGGTIWPPVSPPVPNRAPPGTPPRVDARQNLTAAAPPFSPSAVIAEFTKKWQL